MLYGPADATRTVNPLPDRTVAGMTGVGSGREHGCDVTDEEIVRLLRMRPDFLLRHPSLYLTLAPPARVHGDVLADHMAAMLSNARRQIAQLQDGVRRRRAGRSLGERVEQALLGLIRTSDPLEWIEAELAGTLGVDSAHLWLAGEGRPDGTRLLGGRDIVFRERVTDGVVLHGAASALVLRDVLVRVRPDVGPPGVLALGSRDEGLPGPGSEPALSLLASAIGAAIDRA